MFMFHPYFSKHMNHDHDESNFFFMVGSGDIATMTGVGF